MGELTILESLLTQAPGVVGVILVVILFLRAVEARDKIFVNQMTAITDRLTALEIRITDHDSATQSDRERRADTLERIEKILAEDRKLLGRPSVRRAKSGSNTAPLKR